jgi:hypothetical protein
MIILGDENIKSDRLCNIAKIDDIEKTLPNSTLVYRFDLEILKYCQINNLQSAVIVNTILELIYASKFDAKYIIVQNNDILLSSQKIAENYMFDSKILAVIQHNSQIEKIALDEIDGVIYEDYIK